MGNDVPAIDINAYYEVTESRLKTFNLEDLAKVVKENSQFSDLPKWMAEGVYGEDNDADTEYLERVDVWLHDNSSVLSYLSVEHEVTSEGDLEYEELEEA